MSTASFLDATGAVMYAETVGPGTLQGPFRFVKVEHPYLILETDYVSEYIESTGSIEMATDGSSTPVIFSQPTVVPVGRELVISRAMLFMESAVNFSSELFGGQAALTNGFELLVNGTVLANVKQNIDIAIMTFDSNGQKNLGKEEKTMLARLSFNRFARDGLAVLAGNTFTVTINDDLTGLTFFRVMIQGYLRDI